MRIGVGVITMGRRPIRWLREKEGSQVFVYHDTARRGPAHARNEVIKHLYDSGCDFIFCFDDDCYPVMHGWEDYFIAQHQATGHHFFGLPEAFKGGVLSGSGEIIRWDGLLTQFGFYTRELIETVGYYNTAYDRYGFEDSGYMSRVHRSGLIGREPGFPSPLRTLAYIHSEDVYAESPQPNMSPDEKSEFIERNRPIFEVEVNSSKIYYPYQP